MAQQKPKTKTKPTTIAEKNALPVLQKLLEATKFNYQALNDSTYQINYTGENIKEFVVMVSKISDLYVIAVDITDAMQLELKPEQYKMLLISNDVYDIIKIGLSEYNNHLYVRGDTYSSITTAAILKRLITQVSNVTEIICGELKK